MKKVMATMMLLAGGLFAAPHVAVRIGIGVHAPIAVVRAVVRPVCPGPGYVWTDGYYAPNGGWVAGYWVPPVVRVAPEVRVAPRYDVRRDFDRDDRGHDRDFRRDEHFRR